MQAKSKINLIDKYSPKKEVYEGKKKVIVPQFYCEIGDELEIITENAGEWLTVVICSNKKGQKFTINWNDLEIIKEEDLFTF